jgi:hypothetical protein
MVWAIMLTHAHKTMDMQMSMPSPDAGISLVWLGAAA